EVEVEQSEPAIAEPETFTDEPGMELFDEMNGPRLSITLLDVDDKDRELLLEELQQLGEIHASSGNRESYEVELETDISPDDITAVLCFVIDSDQIRITPAQGKQQQALIAEETTEELSAPEPQENTEQEQAQENSAPAEPVPTVAHEDQQAGPAETKANQPAANGKAKNKGPGESSSIRVSVDKVDQVINLVGELIITQSMLNETAGNLDSVNHSELLNGINLLQRNARDLQDAVMSIRMLPMDYVFSRFPRLVRDLASKLGKEIDLITEGESTELDKGLTERIIDPLTHLVRNSLDHGIELPEVRVANGKPRTGKLVLSAQHQGGNILIEVRDDGGGLKREKILAKAAANGIAVPENASDDEVWQLIFAPGFSTAEQVSDLSGRGVGMDVVKRNIQSMGGHVEIMSKEGQGTTTRIVLPLTLAILDGMLVKVGSQIYIIPVSSIVESLQLRDQSLYSLPGKVPMLKVRDEYYPLVSVASAMRIDSQTPREKTDRSIAVMVQGGSTKYVMLVDELIGQQQVVVKNLESNYRKIEGVSAATILGDGSVALILDIADLYQLGQRNRTSLGENALPPQVPPPDLTKAPLECADNL
ncbi:MAG: chemotaxis protein CheA, partial [Gammaproteobacteria bacterium]